MNEARVRVLLLGESAATLSHLASRLGEWGCQCRYAGSVEEAISLLDRYPYRLIVSARPLLHHHPFVARLARSEGSLYCRYPVENGCWWVPGVREGCDCLGTPALRPSDFVRALGELVAELKSGVSEAA